MTHRTRYPAALALAIGAVSVLLGGILPSSAGLPATSPQVFDTAGTENFTVPPDVCVITVDAIGAQGGTPDVGTPGGLGGQAVYALPVTPGETLAVTVGGVGGLPTGGTPDGAAGGTAAANGGGGGGSSSVEQGGNPVVIAGGGGGSAFGFEPSPGGTNTQAGGDGGGTAGTPGEDGSGGNAGGGGGGGTGTTAGTAGTMLSGSGSAGSVGIPTGSGAGGGGFIGGGGGGGGLFGGGGGAGSDVTTAGMTGGGGGGGSGFTPDASGLSVGVDASNGGDGLVTLTFAVDPGCASPASGTPAQAPVAVTGDTRGDGLT